MKKTMDIKLEAIRKGEYKPHDFIIADAKDGDMAMGMAAPGPNKKTGKFKSKQDYLNGMREVTKSGLVDIMLMSASSADVLVSEGLFENSTVTPAVRLNDTTDIWCMRGNRYVQHPSRPFATIDMAAARDIADLGLYSMTFSNDIDFDYENVDAYKEFRGEADALNFRHFLEIFNPNESVDTGLTKEELPFFINDAIARTLGGVVSAQQPLFLKMAYNGPAALEELAAYDPGNLIVGILGGSAGTTRDTFELVAQAEKYGARVALFGRKINLADDSVLLIKMMRKVVEGELDTAEAVKAYHDELIKKGITPSTDLKDDLEITEEILKG